MRTILDIGWCLTSETSPRTLRLRFGKLRTRLPWIAIAVLVGSVGVEVPVVEMGKIDTVVDLIVGAPTGIPGETEVENEAPIIVMNVVEMTGATKVYVVQQ